MIKIQETPVAILFICHGTPSFMIMHTFAEWGNTGQNMAESIENTTVSTTKAYYNKWDKGKGVGRNP